MSDSQGPGPGALDPHAYAFIPPSTSKQYQTHLPDLGPHHITLLKNTQLPHAWLPPTSEQDHQRLSDTFSEMRYLELNNWDLNSYSEGITARLVDTRSMDSNDTPINYRPWEKPDSSTNQPQPPQTPTTQHQNGKENGVSSTNSPENKSPPTLTPLTNAFPSFSEPFQPPQKLPSFQSQFNAFTDSPQPQDQPSLPSFHTLPATRYVSPHPPPTPIPMVTAPVLAHHHREPQPFLDDRHIQLFPGQVPIGHSPHHHHHHAHHPHHTQFPTTIITQNGTPHNPTYHVQMNGTNYTQVIPSTSAPPTTTNGTATLQLQELVPVPPMHTLLHPAAINVTRTLAPGEVPSLNLNLIEPSHFTQPQQQQQTPHQNGTKLYDQPQIIAVKLYEQKQPQNGHPQQQQQQQQQQNQQNQQHQQQNQQQQQQQQQNQQLPRATPPPPTPKKGKRKRQENGQDNQPTPHQVSSVSSTEPGYKRPNIHVNGTHKHVNGNGHINGHDNDNGLDKPVKKKRKRCGECTGCQRKDNCGECAPCRNDKSHQICKQRRCDKLTEKKTPKSKLKQQQQQQQQQPQPQHH